MLFVLLTFLSCGKDEGLNLMTPENCDVLSSYMFDIDFTEDFGASFQYTNWKSQAIKTFIYSEASSTINVIDQRILCTDISYAPQAILIYEDQTSADFIQLTVSSYLDAEFKPNYFLEEVSGVFSGIAFDELRLVNGTDHIHLDEQRRLVYHDQHNDVLFGFDDRQGNQWLKEGTNASIFYCETRDNIDAYLTTKTSMQFQSLSEKQEHVYTDGFATSYTFMPDGTFTFSNFFGEESNAACVGGKLEIQEINTTYYDFRMASAFALNYALTTEFESSTSDRHYTVVEIRLQYLLKNEELYYLRFILNDVDLYEPQDFDLFSDYIYHETIELDDSSYSEVYQFEYKDRILYFNEQYGVLSFNDHLNVSQYLK